MDYSKKIALYGSLLIFLFMGGCGKNNQREKEWIPTSPASLTNSVVITDSLPEKVTEIDSIYLDKSTDGRTYEINEKKVEIDGKIFLEEDNSVYILAEELTSLLPNISVECDGATCVISCPTYFFDSNALLCVLVKCIFPENGASEIVKSYYYTNGNLYNVTSTSDIYMLKQKEDIYVPLEYLARLYECEFTYDSKTHSFTISGGKISCENINNTVYTPIYPKVSGGYVWTSAGTYRPSNEVLDATQNKNFTSTSLENAIPVIGGEKLKVTCYSSWMPEVATMVYMDDSNKVISLIATSKSTYMKDSIITVPEKATKLLLSLYTNQQYAFYREVTLRGADLSTVSEDEYKDSMLKVLQENREISLENNIGSYKFDKGYLSFVVDDLRPDIDKIADIFEEYDIPLCIAAPDAMLNVGIEGNKSHYDTCVQVVSNGGEILGHNGLVITEDNVDDMDAMFEEFFGRRYYLEEYGFDVKGIILAGGSGQIRGDARTDLYTRTYYQYSDLYGEECYGEPYFHPRTWVNHILDNYEEYISQVANEKKWSVIYFHDLSEVNEEQLRAMLNCVASYNTSELEVVTYSEIYEIAN